MFSVRAVQSLALVSNCAVDYNAATQPLSTRNTAYTLCFTLHFTFSLGRCCFGVTVTVTTFFSSFFFLAVLVVVVKEQQFSPHNSVST